MSPRQVRVVPLNAEHADQVLTIYQAGIDTGDATFETAAPTWEQFDTSKLPDHRFVALDADDTVIGWAAVVPVSDRCVYAGIVEHSVYVAPHASGRGVGTALLNALIDSTEAAGIWTIQSGIFPENTASIALHVAAGFRVVGTRQRVGKMTYGPLAGQWRDVTFLERRSDTAGT